MLHTVTNHDFLRAIFGTEWQRALVSGFRGDPSTPPQGAWSVRAAGSVAMFDPAANSYFCVSTFRPASDGKHRRRKDLFAACHIIVLDDVLEKLSLAEALAKLGAPSYRLRTSPGSEQWGYILATPGTNPARVDALLDGLVAAKLNPSGTDPGMKGLTRLVRLPVGRNGKAKHGPAGVACVLLEWAPGRTFTWRRWRERSAST